MSIQRLASVITFTGIFALAYVSSANPEITATLSQPPAAPEAPAKDALKKGRLKVGGSVAYSSLENTIGVQPAFEYFALDRLVVGTGIGLIWMSGTTQSTSLYPMISYYFLEDGNWAFFARQVIGWTWNQDSGRTMNGSTGFGADFFFNRYVALTPTVSYVYGENRERGNIRGDLALSVFF